MLPSELPDIGDRIVTFDTETSGLYPDDGAQVCVTSVAWHDTRGVLQGYAWPFNQGLYGKPQLLDAYFGVEVTEEPTLDESGAPVLFKSGKRKGEAKTRKVRRELTAEDCLPPNPNLGPDEWRALCQWLSNYRLNAHNGLFDVIMKGTPTVAWEHDSSGVGELIKVEVPGVDLTDNLVWDTMLGNRILDGKHPLNLEDTAHRLFGGGKTDEQEAIRNHLKARRLPYAKGFWHLADWDVMEPYALGDPLLTARVGRQQYQRFYNGEADFEQMADEIKKLRVLVRMERRGIPYNAAESLLWAEKLEKRLTEVEKTLPFDTKPNAVREFYFTKGRNERGVPCLGMRPKKMTKGGEKTPPVAAVDAEVITKLTLEDAPHARAYQEWRLAADAVNRYYRGYAENVGPDGKIRTRFRQTGTATMRLSCERLNLQAIPHDHRLLASGSELLAVAPSPRKLIHAIPEYELWHADLEQAELRVATQFADCQSMWEILKQGRDPHGETAIALNLADGPEDPDWFRARSVIGKRSNFSLIFGIGPAKFQEDLGKNGLYLPLPKVKEIHTDWHGLYPEFKDAIYLHMRLAEKDGWTRIRGEVKKWYSEREIAMHDWHKGFNNRVQGNIGLFTGAWMVEADDYLRTQDIDPAAGLMLQIHDALLMMVPKGPEGRAMAEHCAEIGRQMWKEWFVVPGGVELKPWTHE
jgi:DNA polymerase I-like protein with 3'-5' exonuclease and polymerase domains